MGKVRIILDRWGHHADADAAATVQDESSYWAARRALREAGQGDGEATVIVVRQAMRNWFDDLRGRARVEFVDWDPRVELRRRLATQHLPDILERRPEVIDQVGLLPLAAAQPRGATESAVDWLLRVLVGPAWAAPTVPAGAWHDLLGQIMEHDRTDGLRSELIATRLRQWAAASNNAALTWLAEDPSRRARCLVAVALLSGYPSEVWVQWASAEGFLPAEVEVARRHASAVTGRVGHLAPLALSATCRASVANYLGDVADGQGVVTALDFAKARFAEEVRAVAQHLSRLAEERRSLSPTEAEDVRKWLAEAPASRHRTRGQRLADWLAARRPPSLLAEDATWRTTARWLQDEYLPAYLHLAVTGQLEATESAVAAFEQWLLSRFPGLLRAGEAGAHTFTGEIAGRVAEGRVLLVVLDGAPAVAVKELVRALSAGALQPAGGDLYLSLVPSLTEVSKPCLLAGALPDQTRVQPAIEALAARAAVPLEGVAELDLRPPYDLSAHMAESWRVLVAHVRTPDEVWLHRPLRAHQRWLGVMEEVDRLTTGILDAVRQQGDEPLAVGCLSDHGWTELPDSAEPLSIPEGAVCSHGRVLRGAYCMPGAAVVGSDEFFVPEPWTVASGYRYFGTRPRGAVHGGLTPQELAVWGQWLTTTENEESLPLSLRLEGQLLRGHESCAAELVLDNPNRRPVELRAVRLDRVQPEAAVAGATLDAGQSRRFQCTCDLRGVRDEFLLRGDLQWVARGSVQTQAVDQRVNTRGAATADTDFERMFDS